MIDLGWILESLSEAEYADKRRVKLAAVEAEQGRSEHAARRQLDAIEVCDFLEGLRGRLLTDVGTAYSRSELVVSYCERWHGCKVDAAVDQRQKMQGDT